MARTQILRKLIKKAKRSLWSSLSKKDYILSFDDTSLRTAVHLHIHPQRVLRFKQQKYQYKTLLFWIKQLLL